MKYYKVENQVFVTKTGVAITIEELKYKPNVPPIAFVNCTFTPHVYVLERIKTWGLRNDNLFNCVA